MALKEIRQSRKMSQRELANCSGVNYRSLQDYEQGHKQLLSASYDILFRLSTVLGCTVEELLPEDNLNGAALLPENTLSISEIQSQYFFSEKYATSGRWIYNNGKIATTFFFDGLQHSLPMDAIFTRENLFWLMQAAIMQMEHAIEEIQFNQFCSAGV